MSGHTRQRSAWILGGLCVAGILVMAACAWAEVEVVPVAIDVSPNVLNLQSKSQVVTVHTDLPYPLVDGETVALNGVEIEWWKSDDRGYFVAKFAMTDIRELGLNVGEYNTLTLSGNLDDLDKTSFAGSQDILVVDNVPAGKK